MVVEKEDEENEEKREGIVEEKEEKEEKEKEEEEKEEKASQEDRSEEDGANSTEKTEKKSEGASDCLHASEFLDSLLGTEQIRLFNLELDPNERTNIASSKPEVVKLLLALLLQEMDTRYVDADLLPNDPRANPKYWHNFWSPGWCRAK
ncbi:gem-associated protein 2-like [Penaeus monodon]|uniref:gem-associated protein 2-like n=1 Tax=Penaeus monodon TaxID=6687 RepID=UPI0018A73ADA|nr:gem-associated protein 2-like [Penaeus monodon]